MRPKWDGYSFPGIVKDLVEKCWAQSPTDRPTMLEVINTIQKALDQLTPKWNALTTVTLLNKVFPPQVVK